MVWAGVVDLGDAARGAHEMVGFEPGGEGGGGLLPVGYGGLVAPVEEVGHSGFVGAGEHVVAHALLGVPGGEGPEGEVAVGQEGAGEEAGGVADLADGTHGVEGEEGEETEGADAQAGEADEGHTGLLGFHFLMRRLGGGF